LFLWTLLRIVWILSIPACNSYSCSTALMIKVNTPIEIHYVVWSFFSWTACMQQLLHHRYFFLLLDNFISNTLWVTALPPLYQWRTFNVILVEGGGASVRGCSHRGSTKNW
jgi:hypothetical protein